MLTTAAMARKKTSSATEYNKGADPDDSDMKAELVINDRAEAIVFHNKHFRKNLSWLELNLDTRSLNFIMADGDVRNFGIPVDPGILKYMQNAYQVLMVLMDEKTGEPVEGGYFPLILHRS